MWNLYSHESAGRVDTSLAICYVYWHSISLIYTTNIFTENEF